MKTRHILITCLLSVLAPALASAQGTVVDEGTETGGRVSVELDKKLAKGLHLTLDAEARMYDNFTDFGRYQAGLGMTYKINQWLKVGGGYTFIQDKNSSDEWNPRHRLYGDVTFRLKTGYWTFSLKERLQYTRRDGVNVYQNNPNALALKNRLKAQYNGYGDFVPYAYAELRLALNDPTCVATWNGSSYSDYVFGGYNDIYLNRVRGALGAEYKLNTHHAIDLYLLGDYTYDKEIDTNKEGTKLKSLTYEKGFKVNLGFGYKFSF